MAELVIGKDCRKTWSDLHDGVIGWTLWSMGEDFKHPSLDVLATGSKGFIEMKSYLTPTACIFGGFRVRAIDVKRGIRSVRDRFISFMYAGTETSTIKRARFSGHKPKVFPLMTGVSASFELVGTDPEAFTMSQVARELIACCGAHQPTQYDFEDGGVYYVSGGPDGAVGEVAPKVSDSMKVFAPPPKSKPPPAAVVEEPKQVAPPAAAEEEEEPKPLKLKENTTQTIDPSTIPKNCCHICGKRAYQQESVSIEGSLYHKKCIKCAHCGKVLGVGNYASLNHKFYCKPHFKQLFQSKGNYKFGDNSNSADTSNVNSEVTKPSPRELPKPSSSSTSTSTSTAQQAKPSPRELPKPATSAKSKPRELPKPAVVNKKVESNNEEMKIREMERELDDVEDQIFKLEDEKIALEKKLAEINDSIDDLNEKADRIKVSIKNAIEDKKRKDEEENEKKKELERKRIEEEELEKEKERKRIEEEEKEKERKRIEEEEKELERKRIEEEEEEEKKRIEEEARKLIEEEEKEKEKENIENDVDEQEHEQEQEEEEEEKKVDEEEENDENVEDEEEKEIRALAMKLIEEEEKRKQDGKTLTPEEEEEEERALAMKLLEQEEMEKKKGDSSDDGKYIHNGGSEKCGDFLCDKCHGLGCDCPLCQV